jgi:hypothetical protein
MKTNELECEDFSSFRPIPFKITSQSPAFIGNGKIKFYISTKTTKNKCNQSDRQMVPDPSEKYKDAE